MKLHMWLLYFLACPGETVDQQSFDAACEEGQADGANAGSADRAACTDEHADPASVDVWGRAEVACAGSASAKDDGVPPCVQSFVNGYRTCYRDAYADAAGDGCDTGMGP